MLVRPTRPIDLVKGIPKVEAKKVVSSEDVCVIHRNQGGAVFETRSSGSEIVKLPGLFAK